MPSRFNDNAISLPEGVRCSVQTANEQSNITGCTGDAPVDDSALSVIAALW
jgi:hypothetical protein